MPANPPATGLNRIVPCSRYCGPGDDQLADGVKRSPRHCQKVFVHMCPPVPCNAARTYAATDFVATDVVRCIGVPESEGRYMEFADLSVIAVDDLPEDRPTHAEADGIDLVIVRRGDEVHVLRGPLPAPRRAARRRPGGGRRT